MVYIGILTLLAGIILYCARTKVFFVYPGLKPPPAKAYEMIIIAIGWGLFMYSILSGF